MSVKQLLDLNGRVALVTGGSRGLGLQIAEGLGEMGAKLALTARKAAELEQARQHLEQLGYPTLVVPNDLGEVDGIPALVDRVLEHYGQIDILVNNAGTTWGAAAEEHPLDKWQKVIDVNVTGTFRLSQEVGRRSMLPRGYGRIINIASVCGLLGNPPELQRSLAYNTSKGAVVNFTRALATEWGAQGVTVNCICPGFFPSKMSRVLIERAGSRALEMTPTRRLGGDEDLKGLAVLLASDASRHMTGQIIAVDGGLVAM